MLSFFTITSEQISTMKSTMGELFSDISPIFFLILGVVLLIWIVRNFLR